MGERLDKALVARELCRTRSQAQRLIAAGQVERQVGTQWQKLSSNHVTIQPDDVLRILPGEADRYVSRGGLKLAGALARFGLSVEGLVVLDVGQSTGGFTDCLLQAGAQQVIGVDVGRDQLADSLRQDPRVVCLEGINAREWPESVLQRVPEGGFDLVVMDVSFISQTLILPGLPPLMRSGGWLVSLVKPQFEAGPEWIGKQGVIRDPACYPRVEQRLREAAETCGLSVEDWFDSPITGGDGNREFFLVARKA